MTDDCLDEAFDRLLAGHAVPPEAAPLVAFAREVRAVAALPGRPGAQLAELLATGLLTPPSAADPGREAAGLRGQRSAGRTGRRTVLEILAAAVATVTPARAAAHAAAGLGIVLAGATAAGAAGVLPAPVQGQVSTVLEAVTPFELPGSAERTTADETTPVTHARVATDTGEASRDSGSPGDTASRGELGAQVREEAQRRRVDGQDVSSEARGGDHPDRPATARRGDAKNPPGASSTTSAQGTADGSATPTPGAALPGSPADVAPAGP